jgi:CRP/FNR family transcriptional regulator, cyclic AMP receptor protein
MPGRVAWRSGTMPDRAGRHSRLAVGDRPRRGFESRPDTFSGLAEKVHQTGREQGSVDGRVGTMGVMDWADVAGYAASLLVFGAFYMKSMTPLRLIAIASNVAFIAYGLGRDLYPVLVLHAVLLPLNGLRLWQMHTLVRRVRTACRGGLSSECLIPLMTRRRFETGDVVFWIGEPARSTFLILSGSVRVVELGVTLGSGALLGEVGVFAPGHRRTGTAVCETDVEVGSISDEKLLQVFFEDPAFGLQLTRLVVQRMLVGEARRVPSAPRVLVRTTAGV